MKFLAIDTSAKKLLVVACNADMVASVCAESTEKHSVSLFPAIEEALLKTGMRLSECDLLACVVGPGSFTGIRIGISAVKGMAMGAELPVLGVTSLEAIAYAEMSDSKICLVDAGHGHVYAAGYGAAFLPAGFYSAEEVVARAEAAGAPLCSAEPVAGVETQPVDLKEGLLRAVTAKCLEAGDPSGLAAVYLRKSNAEEKR